MNFKLKKLSLLEEADESGNVSAVCRKYGISRSQFYVWKNRFEKEGEAGLVDHSSAPLRPHKKVTGELEKMIVETALLSPHFGCDKLSKTIFDRCHVNLSGPTIQKVLNKNFLSTTAERCTRTEKMLLSNPLNGTDTLITIIEKKNPVFKDRFIRLSKPGELLFMNNFFAGMVPGKGKIFLHYVIDAFTLFAFASFEQGKHPKTIASIIKDTIAPIMDSWCIRNKSLMVPNKPEYREKLFQQAVASQAELAASKNQERNHEWALCYSNLRSGTGLGAADYFERTIRKEFLRGKFSRGIPKWDNLKLGLKKWLFSYNYSRSIEGYRLFGFTPNQFLNRNLPIQNLQLRSVNYNQKDATIQNCNKNQLNLFS